MTKRRTSNRRYREKRRKEHVSERPYKDREKSLRLGPNGWYYRELDRQTEAAVSWRSKRLGSKIRRDVLFRDQGCICCGYNGLPEFLTIHHIWPRRFGGTSHKENLVTVCTECHKHWNKMEFEGWAWWKWFEYQELSREILAKEREEQLQI